MVRVRLIEAALDSDERIQTEEKQRKMVRKGRVE